jgi:murein DD-endopeptidase MepM/ murein hydrolase activator NlpD
MVRQMRQSLLFGEQEGQGFGNETMTDTFDVEFSRYLAQSGGVGMGQMIERNFDASTNKSGTASGSTTSDAPAPDAKPASIPLAQANAAALMMPLDATTSSHFGWRQDPLGHGRKFHGGVDLKAAYGTDVPAAAGGEVTFAGEQGSYGTLVVLKHDDGVETRYAHLSSTVVKPGERVEAGQVVGRVGSSGRSTGAHLHFEVRRNGQPVDPEQIALAGQNGPE